MLWCENDKLGFLSSSNGQIDPKQPVGQLLIRTIQQEKLRNIVDIGTWNGLGSTRCFLQGMASSSSSSTVLMSLESNKDKNLIAKSNLAEYLEKSPHAQLYWGTILEKDDLRDIHAVFPNLDQDAELRRWHSIDFANMEQAPYLFHLMPDEIDFVLFDGGEFTTYFEFIKLYPRCCMYIALDDVHVSKCKKIREILNADPQWTEVAYLSDRNGFSLHKKVHV